MKKRQVRPPVPRRWARAVHPLTCAYGCEIPHASWFYFGKQHGFYICEGCANKQGITRELTTTFPSS